MSLSFQAKLGHVTRQRTADHLHALPAAMNPSTVAPLFAITYHKIQGGTEDNVILVLNERTSKRVGAIILNSLYVAVTRVRCGDGIRILPCRAAQLEYLTRLCHTPEEIADWNSNYDRDGRWKPNGLNSRRALQAQELRDEINASSLQQLRVPVLKALVKRTKQRYSGLRKQQLIEKLNKWAVVHAQGDSVESG